MSPRPQLCCLCIFGTILPLARSQQTQADLGALPPDLAETLPDINQWGEGEPSQSPVLPGRLPASNAAALLGALGLPRGLRYNRVGPCRAPLSPGLRPGTPHARLLREVTAETKLCWAELASASALIFPAGDVM